VRGRERDEANDEHTMTCAVDWCRASVPVSQALCGHDWSHLGEAAQESLKEAFRRRLESGEANRRYVALRRQAADDAMKFATLRGCRCVPGQKKRRARVIRRVA